tara:strand:+ start:1312 stop:1647 length:336 start_codon:yes stop_codon:yes gene_type:complete
MKRAKLTLFSIAFFAVVTIGVGIGAWLYTSPLARVLSANYAKEMCSCLFVSNLSQEHCEDYSSQYVKPAGQQVDLVAKKVIAWGWGNESHANWISEREGCRLDLAHNISSN